VFSWAFVVSQVVDSTENDYRRLSSLFGAMGTAWAQRTNQRKRIRIASLVERVFRLRFDLRQRIIDEFGGSAPLADATSDAAGSPQPLLHP
jgi:hypothetical protein